MIRVKTIAELVLALFCGPTLLAQSGEKVEFFESRIRPVLIEHCYECHNSTDAAEGELAVDHRTAMVAGGEDGEIIVPGDAAKSRLIAILRHEVGGLEMPENGPKLEESVVNDFVKWIDDGAIDPRDQPPTADEIANATSWDTIRKRRKQWWSFQPIKTTPAPSRGHLVDAFIHHRLKQAGIDPAPPADAAILVRRLYFTLIGLPPSPEQATQWTKRIADTPADQRPDIVNQLVDELIDSPRFGERWARHWMDWIRYAESHGSEGDPRIDNAWLYRDYLIRALNSDVPYDQLIREHIAGDLLDNQRINHELGINESMIGPAHWRMVFHGFAPTDALDERVRYTDDQINAFSKAFLGITVSCARCHNHKFDAISQKDYYALFGVLASCRPARAVIDTPEKQLINSGELSALKPQIRNAIANDWLKQIDANLDQRIDSLQSRSETVDAPIASLINDFLSNPNAWQKRVGSTQTAVESRDSAAPIFSWDLSKRDDYQSWFAYGIGLNDNPKSAGEFAVATEGDTALLGIYPSGVYSHLVSSKHASRLTSSDFQLSERNELWIQVIGDKQARVRYAVHDYPRNGTVYPVSNLNNRWRWQRYDMTYWNGEDVHIELAAGKDIPLLAKNEERSWFGVRQAILQPIGQGSPEIAHESLVALLKSDPPASVADLKRRIRETIRSCITAWKSKAATDEQALFLDACLRENLLINQISQLTSAKPLLEQYRSLESKIPSPTRVPGLDESVAHDWPLYLRGNHKTPSDPVPRRFLEAIDPTPFGTQQSGRLQLAEKLIDESNPLTRRVIVNRIWHHLFGRGIVATPDNFGRLGLKPTHPELLDQLAVRFGNEGWSIKKMIRLVVTSQTWQQSTKHRDSKNNVTAANIDPSNELLSRANVRRIEAESIRDSMFAISGQLNNQLYGPPVGVNDPRRSVYMRVIRNSLDPFLRTFDFPEPFSAKGRRDITNVPAQSLTLMNDPLAERHARQWSSRLLKDPSLTSNKARANRIFLTAFGRSATDSEVARVLAYIDRTRSRIQQHQQDIGKLNQAILDSKRRIKEIIQPMRKRLLAEIDSDSPPTREDVPNLISHWDFSQGAKDLVGDLHGELKNGATIKNGALTLNGGYMVTLPLAKTITDKTLEAWVQLDSLDQRGGGVMTIQTLSGSTFDSIVFGERDPAQWMSGSNGFARTQGFDAKRETDATDSPVHVAIVYRTDGKIIGYRNGQPYGKPYQSSGPFKFKRNETLISFGVRHLPARGGRMLFGRVVKANLYDRALTADEIAYTAGASSAHVSDETVLSRLTEQQRNEVIDLRTKIAKQQSQLALFGKPPSTSEQELWSDVARAIFTFQEFIYLR